MIKIRYSNMVCLLVGMIFLLGEAKSQDAWRKLCNSEAEQENLDQVRLAWSKQDGVKECDECHSRCDEGSLNALDRSFSRRLEMKFWLTYDKHAIARRRVEPLSKIELLEQLSKASDASRESDPNAELNEMPEDWFGVSTVLSRRICDKLGYNVTEQSGYEKFRNNCLTCHGGYHGSDDDKDFAKDGGWQPGISCNYCHQIDDNTTWIGKHAVQGVDMNWRNLSPAEKTAAGMRDLVNVGTQAANCYDCHIGNRNKNMFVTHVMYAAGHPPLPGIELQTFCSSMPQHWQTESELSASLSERPGSPEARDVYFKQNFPALFATATTASLTSGKTLWNTRKIVIGALAARLHGVSLLADSATPERWADYSLYDCAACHHELREPSRRQARGYAGAPGDHGSLNGRKRC